jgi:hypothetical protein
MSSVPLAPALVLVAAALGVGCHRDASRAVIAAGRGGLRDTSSVQITRIATATEAMDYDGHPVAAGAGSVYVLLDCRITVPSNQVDISDFQLVQSPVTEIGTETNLGNHEDEHYFYWTYLDDAARPLATAVDPTGPLAVRLAFKIPVGTRGGYLYYWGLFWGPLNFPSAAR